MNKIKGYFIQNQKIAKITPNYLQNGGRGIKDKVCRTLVSEVQVN